MSKHIVSEHDRSVDSLLDRRESAADSRVQSEETKYDDLIVSIKGRDYIIDPLGVAAPVSVGPTINPDDPGGTGKSSSWSGTYVNDALSAASQAISAFLTGQSLGDARKLAASEQMMQAAGWALPPGVMPPGFGEGGAMHNLAALGGQKNYTPPPNERVQINPSALVQPAQVSPDIMAFIDTIINAGNSGGKVVSTGGSSSG